MKLVENSVVAGRFRLNRLLGRGGMGSVWHATHLGLDVPCAVKFIEGTNAVAPDAQARFEREAKAGAQLRSPHVVQIFDHGICDGTPYIAMELLDGEDLGKRLMRLQRMPASVLCPIVAQVCRALTRAHQLGIVHRDLKPDNIFLVHDDEREIAKVLDFGIAKTSAQALAGSATRTGALLGTPHYMSPEQAQGIKQVDFRSDLWSLAVICFRALTGRLPFQSDALGDLLIQIIVAPVPVPSECGPVPEGFDAWWSKAARREPSERFQSARDFSDSLSAACGVSQRGSFAIPVTLSHTAALPTLQVPPAQGAPPGALVQGGLPPIAAAADVPPLVTAVPTTRSFQLTMTGPSMAVMSAVGVALALIVIAGALVFWRMGRAPRADAQSAALTATQPSAQPSATETSAPPPPSPPPPAPEAPSPNQHEPPIAAPPIHRAAPRAPLPPNMNTSAKPPKRAPASRDLGF